MGRWRQILTFLFAMALGSGLTWLIMDPRRADEPRPSTVGKRSVQERVRPSAAPQQGAGLAASSGKRQQAVRVDLQPLAGGKASGTLVFMDVGEAGVRVDARLRNLRLGEHWLEVHEKDSCAAPDGSSTGAVVAAQNAAAGPLVANVMGRAQGSVVLAWARLAEGANGLLNRAVVVRGEGTGALACGVVR